jgi:uncharacterized protein YqeY
VTASDDLSDRLDRDATQALRDGDKLRLSVLRRARAALKNAEIDARTSGGTVDATRVLQGQAKRHRESIEQFTHGGRQDLVDQEVAELAILEDYLPAQASDADIEAVVRDVIAEAGITDPKQLGTIMRPALDRIGPGAEGGRVRDIAQRVLAE